jgi:hypothetical protein
VVKKTGNRQPNVALQRRYGVLTVEQARATHTYDQPGTYKVLVKVVDIFGNDTTKMVEVEIP